MNAYQREDGPFFNYNVERVAGLLVRGPVPNLTSQYFVCVGAAQSFGRYVHTPYPHILATKLNLDCLNLSVGGAGPSLFQTEGRLKIMNQAKFVVVQVLSGRAESNSIFESDGKATLRVKCEGLRYPTAEIQQQVHAFQANLQIPPLRDLQVPKGIQLHSTLAYRILAESKDDLVCELAIQESKLRYTASMIALLRQIKRPKILLYFSDRAPGDSVLVERGQRKYRRSFDIEGRYPQFVDEEVMKLISYHADEVAFCVSLRGKPHMLPEGMTQVMPDGTSSPIKYNDYYPTPEMHEDAATVLFRSIEAIAIDS